MGKRSRDVSYSPSADVLDHPTPDSQPLSDSETSAHPGKEVKLLDRSPLLSETVMQCSLPPHRLPIAFTTIEDFEVHYAKEHSNRCSSCGKNFPVAHFLALHIDENHNVLREALQAKGEKTYTCFVEDCDRKCSTPQKRRMHLIDKHMFPKVYNFRIVDNGIDRASSMLKEGQRRRVSTSENQKESFGHRRRTSSGVAVAEDIPHLHGGLVGKDQKAKDGLSRPTSSILPGEGLGRIAEAPSLQNGTSNTDVDELERSMSALRFIPSSVSRYQGKKKAVG